MDLRNYFKFAAEKNASDLHLISGCAPTMRINGELIKIAQDPLDGKELKESIFSLLDENSIQQFKEQKEMDFSYEIHGIRCRINLHFQEGEIGLAARLLKQYIPRPIDLDFNETIYKLTHLTDGLILVTGPSGSGKSTTLAAMINIINRERRAHIITIEDPIEYLFTEDQSIIEQRELGSDTKNFAKALKYALRQDPNVIMVGEMRDLETMSAAITAAETGHLVLSTLHTSTAPETIERIVDSFPAHQQQQIMVQISLNLRAVITQQLIPRKGGGLVVAREIMINNQAIANLIRRNQISQIYSVIQTSHKEGMITMNKAVENLYKNGIIDEDVSKKRKRDLDTKAVYY